jgi:REP element-mobilizing transposase RayT
MPQSFACLHVHIVFSTKHRQPFITTELRPRLHEYLGGIFRELSCPLIAAGGMEDHVHLLTSLSRTSSIASVVKTIKANSSGWIHREFKALSEFQWQQGYGAFAISYSNIGAVKEYIAHQEEHHSRMSFQVEFREFLRRHGIEWDEQYIWD